MNINAHDVYVLPIRLVTWLLCLGLVTVSLPLVIYLRAYDALDESADAVNV